MMHLIPRCRSLVRGVSLLLLPPLLVLVCGGMLVAQYFELFGNQEVLPLTSFVVLLSFAGLALSWCRVRADFTPEETLRRVYLASIDLFVSSLMALVSTAFSWVLTTQTSLPPALFYSATVLHWISLLLALLLFLVAILTLLQAARNVDP